MKIAIRSGLQEVFCSLIARRWFVVLLILSPIILEAIYIKIFGVNVPFWDQLGFVPYLEKLYTNDLSFFNLFQQHNEHRLFFPRIIMLILAYMSNYNNIYEMYFSWILALFILLLVFLIYKNNFQTSTRMLAYFIPVSFLIFNLRQYENILWGFQIQVYLCVLGFLISIYMMGRSNKLDSSFFVAASAGVLASYSFADGLAVWPAGLFFILLSNRGMKNAAVWSLVGLLTSGIYFYHWIKPQGHPSTFFIIQHPIEGLLYFAGNVGSPLAFNIAAAIGTGIILLVLLSAETLILFKYNAIRENAKWLAIILFSLISSFSLTVFRAGFGIEQSTSSRYVTITLLAVIGIYFLVLDAFNKNSKNKANQFLLSSLIFILTIGLIQGYICGLVEGSNIGVSRTDYAYYLRTYNQQTDDNLRKLYPDSTAVREMAQILEKYKLNVFSYAYANFNTTNESSNKSSLNMRNINNIIQKYVGLYRQLNAIIVLKHFAR